MYSKYWNTDIPIKAQSVESNGEEVFIIPHNELEKAIFNSEMTTTYNINVHYTHIPTNEAWHYVFLCAISDNQGRRIEAIGESLGATLETTIARNYPSLMAYKRAFDAAAITYLDLDCAGKLYSDQQCSTTGDASTDRQAARGSSPSDFSSPDEDDEDVDTADEPAGASEEPASRTSTKSASKQSQPSFEAAEDDDEDGDEEDASQYHGAPDDVDDDDASDAAGYAAADDDEDDDLSTDQEDMSRFDVVVNIGAAKGKGLTIPQVYADSKLRRTLNWIANDYTPYNDSARKLKQLCAEYLEIMGGK